MSQFIVENVKDNPHLQKKKHLQKKDKILDIFCDLHSAVADEIHVTSVGTDLHV